MKYLIRSLKYLLYFVIIFCLCLAIVVLFSHQSFSDIPSLFKEGSFLPICLIFLGFALLYPAVGYRKAKLVLDGEWKDYRNAIMKTMEGADYELVSETNRTLIFRSKRAGVRFSRMWEDAITFEQQENDPALVKVDGPSRDTLRLVGSVYYNYRMEHPQSEE